MALVAAFGGCSDNDTPTFSGVGAGGAVQPGGGAQPNPAISLALRVPAGTPGAQQVALEPQSLVFAMTKLLFRPAYAQALLTLPNATVTVYNENNQVVATGTTDTRGEVTFTNLPQGFFRFVATNGTPGVVFQAVRSSQAGGTQTIDAVTTTAALIGLENGNGSLTAVDFGAIETVVRSGNGAAAQALLNQVTTNVQSSTAWTNPDGSTVTDNQTQNLVTTAANSVGGAGGNVANLVTQGLTRLQAGTLADIVAARDLFAQAVAAVGANTNTNDRDRANFFYALTRVGAVAGELPSDGNTGDRNQVGDFLDVLGVAAQPRTNYTTLVYPGNFGGGVTGEQVREFLRTRMRSELEGALVNLGAVSNGFAANWSFDNSGTTLNLESDFGDVLALRAAYRVKLAGILIATGYSFGGADAALELNNPNRSLQTIFGNNPAAATQVSTADLTTARDLLSQGLDEMVAALDAIQAEQDPQADDLVNVLAIPASDITEFRNEVAAYKSALTSATTTRADDGSTANLDLPNYFANGLNLRQFLPPLNGDRAAGPFANNPFAPVYVPSVAGSHADPNRDISPQDGVPDILQ